MWAVFAARPPGSVVTRMPLPEVTVPLNGMPPRMTLASGLADASGAIRLLKAHPDIPEAMGVVGFSFGGAVAALVAGRDSRIRAAVLAAAPGRFGDDEKFKPIAEITRTRARVLLLCGSRDTQVRLTNAERYAAVLSQARVSHRTAIIEGGDQESGAVAQFHVYPATKHWFDEPSRPEFDKDASALAFERTLAFLDRHL
jgi:carboxymethylenebutenolidase